MSLGKRLCFLHLAIVLVCTACATTGKDSLSKFSFVKLKETGEKFFAAGDIPQALKFFLEAEKKNPNDPSIHYDLGLAYGSRKVQADALKHFQKALALKPDYAQAQNAMGTIYAEQGKYDLAQDCFQKALANPFYETPQFASYNLGQLYEKKGDPEAALKAYQEAIRFEPSYGIAYFRIGQLQETFRHGDEARQAYGRAVRCSPNIIEAQYRYGVMSYQAGELESALYSLTRVVKMAPDTTMAEDAKKYLEKLQGIIPAAGTEKSGFSSPDKLMRMEVLGNQDISRQPQPAPAAAPVAAVPKQQPAQSPPEDAFALAEGASAPQDGQPPAQPPAPQWLYVVQMASFLDKEHAEELHKTLEKKGYNAVVKPLKHQVLGLVYVVQLKPVGTISKASTLMTQLEGDVKGKLVVIKIPVGF